MKDVKIPDSAQFTLASSAEYEIISSLDVNLSYYQASNVYADFDISDDDSFIITGNLAWELPSYGLLDGGRHIPGM